MCPVHSVFSMTPRDGQHYSQFTEEMEAKPWLIEISWLAEQAVALLGLDHRAKLLPLCHLHRLIGPCIALSQKSGTPRGKTSLWPSSLSRHIKRGQGDLPSCLSGSLNTQLGNLTAWSLVLSWMGAASVASLSEGLQNTVRRHVWRERLRNPSGSHQNNTSCVVKGNECHPLLWPWLWLHWSFCCRLCWPWFWGYQESGTCMG